MPVTTVETIAEWFERGVQQGATHMIVVCDTFDHEDYPVFVMPGEDARAKAAAPGAMQRVMEVYNLAMDRVEQLSVGRAHNY